MMHFIVAELVWALGVAFISGTEETFLSDWLKDAGRSGELSTLSGRQHAIARLAALVMWFLGASIVVLGLRAALWAAVLSYLLAVCWALSLKEPPTATRIKCNEQKRWRQLRFHAQELWGVAYTCLWQNRQVRWLIAVGASLGALQHTAFWLVQPFLLQDGWSQVGTGYLAASMGTLGAMIGFLGERVKKILGFTSGAVILWCLL